LAAACLRSNKRYFKMDVQLNHEHITQPSYFYVTDFEKNFDYKSGHKWMKDNHLISFYCCVVYLLLIFAGRYYMSNRPKFELRGLLAIWSGALALLSIVFFVRTVPETYNILSNHGFYHSICTPRRHSFHCVTETAVDISTLVPPPHSSPLYMVLLCRNLRILQMVHLNEQFYSFLDAMKVNLPKWLAMTITILQIAQMFWGIFVTISAYYYAYVAQVRCNVPVKNLTFTTLMYLSYLILFINFFKQNYFSNKRAKQVERKRPTKTE
ncbi:unnamed protein product, partial [Heterotrigona itama]